MPVLLGFVLPFQIHVPPYVRLPGETYVAGCRNIQKIKAADRGSHRGFEESGETSDCQSTRRSLSDKPAGLADGFGPRAALWPIADPRAGVRANSPLERCPSAWHPVVRPPRLVPPLSRLREIQLLEMFNFHFGKVL